MHLRSLQLTNYRNFRRLALTLDDGPSIIQGANAQGKSNLLEAIEILATTKAERAGSDRELIHWEILGDGSAASVSPSEPFARVHALVARERGETRAEVLLRAIPGTEDTAGVAVSKSFRINGVPRRALEFIGEINVVTFSPEDVELVAGSPSVRRRYLDITNAQMNMRYLRTLQRYNKVLLQRNHLLRQVREGGRSDPSLPVWDQELALNGAYVFQERARAVQALSARADQWFHNLGGWGHELVVRYLPGLPVPEAAILQEPATENDEQLGRIHTEVQTALARSAGRERAAGMSLVGPHRDELTFAVDGINLNTFGSRGQQRLAALAMKVAEVELIEERVGSRPILLLDDVLSELDPQKQAAVLHVAGGSGQTILTVTAFDEAQRRHLPHAAIFHLAAGALTPASTPAST